MSAYLITNVDVKDAAEFAEYRAKVPDLVRSIRFCAQTAFEMRH